VEKISRINDLLGPSEFVCVFKFGSMPMEQCVLQPLDALLVHAITMVDDVLPAGHRAR
jgi:hypothetical protein